ncbi:MAG: hypothetical protein ABFC34_15975 [Methanobacterium sp.]
MVYELAILGTLGGVILAYGLNEYSKYKQKAENKKSTRVLVRLEIDQNLEFLQYLITYTKKIEQILKDEGMDQDDINLKIAEELVERPMFTWTDTMWEKQTAFLAVSFQEDEIKKIYKIYSSFRNLDTLYNKLYNFYFEDKKHNKTKPTFAKDLLWVPAGENFQMPQTSDMFIEYVPKFLADFKGISRKLLENGNPIKS